MKVQMLKSYGPKSTFSLEEIAKPSPKAGEVLIKIKASGINPADYKGKELGSMLDFVPPLPAILGMDVSGIVESVGEGVTKFQVGDIVFGTAGGVGLHQGSLAQWMSADQRLLTKVSPKTLQNYSFKELASVPLVAITAWNALFDFGKLKPGQKVLVYGAGGAVGLMTIQLAKWAGAYVVASARKNKMDLAKVAGADIVVTPEDEKSLPENFDLIVDTIGGDHLSDSFQRVKRGGKVATTIGFTTLDLSLMHIKSLTLHVVYMLMPMMYNEGKEKHGEILDQISYLLDNKLLKSFIDEKSFTLEEANLAYDYAALGKTQGKVVIDVL